ncbi:MAG TPA: hypothetical protein VN654_03210 [Vicinamibacterales bacterium]|jgi:hypothetical protein|nr:hypothetical protein [Vicinamibacterales bacterium]
MKRECVMSGAVVCLLGMLSGSAYGQSAVVSETTWGGFGVDAPSGVAVAVDGSSYVTGITDSFTRDQFGNSSPKIFLVKFDATGSVAWQRIWNGNTVRGLGGPAVALHAGTLPGNASDDSIYVTGLTSSGGNDAVLLKFDALGNLVWQRTWGGVDLDVANGVATAADGPVYIVGHTNSFGASGSGLFVVKFDPAGAMIWQKVWDGSGGFEAITVGPDGSVYAAATTARDGTFAFFDLVALKITSDGVLLWQREYAAGDDADPRGGMTVASDGSIYIAGALQAPKIGISALVVRLSAAGALLFDGQWAGRTGTEVAAGIAAAADGSVYFAGTTSSSGAGGQDAFVVHLLPSGKVAGAATWGGAEFDEGAGVAVAADGSVRLAALAQAPPYALMPAAKRVSNVKGTLAAATAVFGDAFGTAVDAGDLVTTPAGSTTFAGNVDAALVRLAP